MTTGPEFDLVRETRTTKDFGAASGSNRYDQNNTTATGAVSSNSGARAVLE